MGEATWVVETEEMRRSRHINFMTEAGNDLEHTNDFDEK